MTVPVTCPVMIILYLSEQHQLGLVQASLAWAAGSPLFSPFPLHREKGLWGQLGEGVSPQSTWNHSPLICFWLSFPLKDRLSLDHERLLRCLFWAFSLKISCVSLPYWSPGTLVVGQCLCTAPLCTMNISPTFLPLPPPPSRLNLSLKSQIRVSPLPWQPTWYHSDFLFSCFPEMSLQTVLTWLPWTWDPQETPPLGS